MRVKVRTLRIFELRIPFKTAFKHASAERVATQTLWIEAESENGLVGYGEGCPREYVTSETLATARDFVRAHTPEWLGCRWDLASLLEWTQQHRALIDTHPAAWTAVETALLDLLGKHENRSVESLLDLPELAGVRTYTAVLGASSAATFTSQLSRYLAIGFRDFKIKLQGDLLHDRAAVETLVAAGISPSRVRADANNVWPDAATAIGALQALNFPFFAVEEPVAPGDFTAMETIARACDVAIILDESLRRTADLATYSENGDRWIPNVRVSKMGGLLRTLEFLQRARAMNFRVIVGAHVGETSLLTRVAFTAASAAGAQLVAQEGGFGTHLLATDIVDPPLMFGAGGRLDLGGLPSSRAPGFGLKLSAPLSLHEVGGD